jgi:hypothetical protein
MRSAFEMKEISNDVIRKQTEVHNEIIEKIDNYIYQHAIDGLYYCYIDDKNELWKYICDGLIRQRLNIAGYTITPVYDLKGELYCYKIEWK